MNIRLTGVPCPLALLGLVAIFPFSLSGQTVGGCPVFPSNNIWNARVDTLPVHPLSNTWVNTIGATRNLHQDFGGSLYNGLETGMSYNVVPGTQPKVAVTFSPGADESDPGPYPIPANAKIEGGPTSTGDRHVLIADTDNCILYEMFYAFPNGDGTWRAYSGAKFDLRSNALRPWSWTSADAAGLPIFAGLARYEDILAGELRHALRFTAPQTRREFVWPARHYASSLTDPIYPPMGARFRLKANFDVSTFSPIMQILLNGLKKYGMMLSDNGGSWYVQGTYDPRWPDLVTEFRRVPGSAFEAVDASSLMVNVDSGEVRGSTPSAALDSISLTPTSVNGGQSATLRVNLTAAAPSGGLTVTLGSSNSAAASAAGSVTVPAGASSAQTSVSTSGVASTATVTFTAVATGVQRQATLTVNAPALSSLSVNPGQVTGAAGATGRVTLSGAAPSGGLTVSLSSSNTAAATVGASVVVAGGQSSADFPVTTKVVAVDSTSSIQASMAGVSRSAPIQVLAPAPSLNSVTASLAGTTLQIGVTLSSAAPGTGVSVALSGSNNSVAPVPSSIVVPGGASSASTTVTATLGSSAVTLVVTASLNGVVRQTSVNIPAAPVNTPAALSSISLLTSPVRAGSEFVLRVTLTRAAPAGGAVVYLRESSGVVRVRPSVLIPAGATSVSFGAKAQRTGQATVTASYAGVSRSATVTVQ